MELRDLMPWNNGCRELGSYRGEGNPFLSLHREMNRLFDDAFRSFDVAPFGSAHATGWPNVEVSETDKEVKVMTGRPGLEQKDVAVELANGMLTISGKKSETEDKERRFSERYYGRFGQASEVADRKEKSEEDCNQEQLKPGCAGVPPLLPRPLPDEAPMNALPLHFSLFEFNLAVA